MLCRSTNVVKWKIQQGRGFWNGNMLAKNSVQFRLYLIQSCLGWFFSPSLYIWTLPAKNFNPTRRNCRVSYSPQSSDPANKLTCSTTLQKTSTEKEKNDRNPNFQSGSFAVLIRRPRRDHCRDMERNAAEREINKPPRMWHQQDNWTEEEEESLDWARGTCAHRVSILIRLRWDCKGFAAAMVNETCGAVAAKTRLDSCLAVTYISHRRSGF